MKFKLEHSLQDYIATGDSNTTEIIESQSLRYEAIQHYYLFFKEELWGEGMHMSPYQAFLSMHAFMLWNAAVRVALTGHASATMPLFRTSLEAACYAYLLKKNDAMTKIWSGRNDSSEALKECRRKFTSAVRDAGAKIDAERGEAGFSEWLIDAYDNAIDHGAHPNPRSIFPHVRAPEDAGEYLIFNLVGLYDPRSFETESMLVACLDYGQLIATTIAHCATEITPEIVDGLTRLNGIKVAAVSDLMDGPDLDVVTSRESQ